MVHNGKTLLSAEVNTIFVKSSVCSLNAFSLNWMIYGHIVLFSRMTKLEDQNMK